MIIIIIIKHQSLNPSVYIKSLHVGEIVASWDDGVVDHSRLSSRSLKGVYGESVKHTHKSLDKLRNTSEMSLTKKKAPYIVGQ